MQTLYDALSLPIMKKNTPNLNDNADNGIAYFGIGEIKSAHHC